MKILQTLLITTSLVFLSCTNNRMETSIKGKNVRIDSVPIDTILELEQQTAISFPDSIKGLVVDDYPITEGMLSEQSRNILNFRIQSGKIISCDKIWFGNDSLKQSMIFDLYTDYHRLAIYHFYNDDIPGDMMSRIDLQLEDGELASERQKLKDFKGFLKQTNRIDTSYFVTQKGFRLGNTKQKAIDIYGNPDKTSKNNRVEILEWSFIGDQFYDGKLDLKGKQIAKDSYGYQVVMFFKEEKLIGQIIYNEIP